jgi:hypothetical protein
MLFESNVVGVDHRFFSVGNNPESFASMRGADACSWNIERPDFVTFSFQVRTHSLEDHAVLDVSKAFDIFSNNPPRGKLLDDSKHNRPEVSVVIGSCLFACDRERLARETSCDDIGKLNSVCNEFFFCDFFDIVIYLNSFPVFLQH